jgi:uncharacterized protein involved in tellurium resistance
MKLKNFFTGIFDGNSSALDKIASPLSKIWDGAKSMIPSVGNLLKSDNSGQSLSSKLPSIKNEQAAITKNQNNSFTINVNASKISDPREIAKQVSKEMKNFSGAFLYDAVGELP